jgi:hypothetical protein
MTDRGAPRLGDLDRLASPKTAAAPAAKPFTAGRFSQRNSG